MDWRKRNYYLAYQMRHRYYQLAAPSLKRHSPYGHFKEYIGTDNYDGYHKETTGHKRKVSKAESKINCIQTSNYGDFGLTTYDSTERYPTSIWKFATDKQKCSLHPTQKPIELCRYAIRTYTNEGDLVVDFCCGSGSILKAAQLENRNYIGIDNGICDRKGEFENWFWADVAKYRLKNMDR